MKGVLKYVYEVPNPEHIFIKVSDSVVYDLNDGVYYVPCTQPVDTLVHGYAIDLGCLPMLRKHGYIGKLM